MVPWPDLCAINAQGAYQEIVNVLLDDKAMEFLGNQDKQVNVLFVCMGNICRSPTAHGVFQKLVQEQSLQQVIGVDSAGTYAYHAGEQPDFRARAAAAKRGYCLEHLRARKIDASDFSKFDYILAMDNENMQDLLALCEEDQKSKVRLLLEFTQDPGSTEVPDPYFGTPAGFEAVLDLVEEASRSLLEFIRKEHALKATVECPLI